jgi:hypothetical protein
VLGRVEVRGGTFLESYCCFYTRGYVGKQVCVRVGEEGRVLFYLRRGMRERKKETRERGKDVERSGGGGKRDIEGNLQVLVL